MTVSDTWKDWKTTAALDTPPSTATPEIDKELRNIKAQVKANVSPALYFADVTELGTLITSIGSDLADIITDQVISITTDTVIPDNINIKVTRPGGFDIANTKTLTMRVPEAGRFQIFTWTGSGKVVLIGRDARYPEWWGAAGDGITDDTDAFDACMLANPNDGSGIPMGGTISLAKQTYVVDTLTNWTVGVRMVGQSMYYSILLSKSGNTILNITGSDPVHSFVLSNFRLMGNGGTGHGLHIDNSAQPFSFSVSNMFISDMGGKGIYDTTGFSSKYRDILVTNCGDHAVEGNFTVLDNIYVADVPTAGKCGFRIYNSPAMVGCNGVNSGDYWGIFGATIALDGFLSYSSATLIGCNVEDFEVCGILCRDGSSPNFQGHTTILAPSTGTVMAVQLQGGTNRVPLWEGLDLSTKGAAWTNGYAIHAQGDPCLSIYQNASSPVAYYNDDDGLVYQIASLSTQYPAPYVRGVGLNAAWIGGSDNNIRVDANGEMTFHGTASIDGIAISAEGSVPTTGTYKQGAVIFNSVAATGQPAGWMCVTTGTFSAYSTTGTTDGLTGTVTSVGSTAAVSVNDYITIATTTNGPFRVLSKTSNTLVVSPTPDTAGVGVAIATSDPTFKAMGNLA